MRIIAFKEKRGYRGEKCDTDLVYFSNKQKLTGENFFKEKKMKSASV
jgi:hypothetical protein